MTNRTLPVRLLSLLLALCLLLCAAPALAEEDIVVAPTEEEIVTAPVDDAVPEAEADLWTKEIALDVEAAEAENPVADKSAILIDEDHFPDRGFRLYISTVADRDLDGMLSDEERERIVELQVTSDGAGIPIQSLEGIEYFTRLENLDCAAAHLTELDLSGNTTLKALSCGCAELTSLMVGGCTALKVLDCGTNQISSTSSLTYLDIAGCPSLTELHCSGVKLTRLDLSGLAALTHLYCYDSDLTQLDLSGLAALGWLDAKNCRALALLDVSGCAALRSALLYGNPLLASVNICDCPQLVRAVTEGSYAVQPVSFDTTATCAQYEYHDDASGTTALLYVDPGVEILTTPVAGEPTLAATKATIGVKQKYQVLAADSPVQASACRFKSSNRKVATVNKKGVVKGVKPGKVTITVTAPSGAKLKCKITVKKAPKKITLSRKKAELAVGNTVKLKAKITSGSVTAITWTSSDEAVATVKASGTKTAVVTAVGRGTATVTATTSNGLSAACEVKVTVPPTKIRITTKARKVEVGKQLTLKTKLTPANAETTLKWKSDNPEVAVVHPRGIVTGLKTGTANITVTTANGLQATAKITVVEDKVTYRALLVGQVNYDPDFCESMLAGRQDVLRMGIMLKTIRDPSGRKYAVTSITDVSYKAFKKAIKTTFADADANDVSLLFYIGHGGVNWTGSDEGALTMVPKGKMTLRELAGILKNVPGKVVVILGSCGSGTAIYEDGVAENGLAANRAAAEFDAAVVDAFASVDPGIIEDADGNVVDADGLTANVGDLRVLNKFYVLTATRRGETAWMNSDYSMLTDVLLDGVGPATGDMPADTNHDNILTLNELFIHIRDILNQVRIRTDDGVIHYQHVQVYPKNCNFKLFKR